jgi:hypothetical protein
MNTSLSQGSLERLSRFAGRSGEGFRDLGRLQETG